MKKAFWLLTCGAVVAAILFLSRTPSANAVPEFKNEFVGKYVKADSADAKDKAFADACEKAKCNICHAGKTKKERNAYGATLGKLLNKETDKENKEKIRASLEKAAGVKSKPDDPKSPTFGELISAGELPGGQSK